MSFDVTFDKGVVLSYRGLICLSVTLKKQNRDYSEWRPFIEAIAAGGISKRMTFDNGLIQYPGAGSIIYVVCNDATTTLTLPKDFILIDCFRLIAVLTPRDNTYVRLSNIGDITVDTIVKELKVIGLQPESVEKYDTIVYAKFSSNGDAKHCATKLNFIEGRFIPTQIACPTNVVLIFNPKGTIRQFDQHYSQFGKITDIKPSQGYKQLEIFFTSWNEAHQAARQTNGTIFNNSQLKVMV